MSTKLLAKEAIQSICDAKDEARRIGRELGEAIQQARSFKSPKNQYGEPTMTPAGVQERQREMESKAKQVAAQRIAELRERVQINERTVSRFEVKSKQVPDASQMARQQAAWSRQQRLLDAGRSPFDLVARASDEDTLRALIAELPTWLESRSTIDPHASMATAVAHGMGMAEQLVAPAIVARAERRLAETVSGDEAKALGYRLDAQQALPAVHAQIDGVEAEAEGRRSAMHTAIAVRMAEAAGAGTGG